MEKLDHSCGSGPHEILAVLLGQSSTLSLLVVTVLSLVSMLIIILNDPGRDIAGAILLT